MISGYESYSFRKRHVAAPVLALLRFLALLLIVYHLVSGLLVAAYRVDSVSMQPALRPGERVLASPLPLGLPVPLAPEQVRRYREPVRGDLVVFRPPSSPQMGGFSQTLEGVVRFFTFNRRSLAMNAGRPVPRLMIKRVIGIPGDTVRMEDMVAYIKPADHAGFQIETQVVPTAYQVEGALENWHPDLPFSGDLAPTVLGRGEYLLLGDNRAHSSDSRAWGAVSRDRIWGVVLIRYWPVSRFGRL